MRRLRFLLAACLALIWVPVTSHCLLEDAGLIHHSECCEPHESDAAGHDAADGNCRIESSGFQLPKPHELLAPVLLDPLGLPVEFHAQSAACALTAPEASDSPPRLLAVTWQFLSRSAPSPRAPSRLS